MKFVQAQITKTRKASLTQPNIKYHHGSKTDHHSDGRKICFIFDLRFGN